MKIASDTIERRITKLVRRFSIRKRLFIIYFIQVGVVALWCGFAINTLISDYTSYIKINNTKLINVFAENMSSILSALESITKYPVLRTNAQPTMTYKYLSDPSKYSPNTLYNDLDSKSSFFFDQHSSIRLVAIFDLEGNGSFIQNIEKYVYDANATSKLFVANELIDSKWFQDTLLSKGGNLIWNMEDLKNTIVYLDNNWIFASRAIFNTERFENIGVILAAADLKDNFTKFESNKIFEKQKIGVFDYSGRLIAGNLDEDKFDRIYQKAMSLSGTDSIGSFILNINGKSNMYNYSNIFNDYFCILETPYNLVISNILKQQVLFLILILFSFFFISVSTKLIVNSITNPLKNLVGACEKIKDGNFSVHISDKANDELSDFTDSFNSMTQQINRLIHEVYEQDITITKIELQMLRSQINPHLVYNILETIRTTALMNNERELSEMAFLLASNLRYGISQPTEIVSVKREIEMIELYVRLQKLLYKDKINFTVHIEPVMLNFYMLKLLLQPIVENALLYGIDPFDEKIIINLLGFTDGNCMIFQIVDNGIGMSQEKLDKLRGYINGENNFFKGIGLKNVHRRIQLYYGKEYGITINSSPGKGTMISTKIPIKLKEKGEIHV